MFYNHYSLPGLSSFYFMDNIIKVVSNYFETDYLSLTKKNRKSTNVKPRQFICYYLRQKTNLTLKDIGMLFKQDHSTVLYSVTLIDNLISIKDESTLTTIDHINQLLLVGKKNLAE